MFDRNRSHEKKQITTQGRDAFQIRYSRGISMKALAMAMATDESKSLEQRSHNGIQNLCSVDFGSSTTGANGTTDLLTRPVMRRRGSPRNGVLMGDANFAVLVM